MLNRRDLMALAAAGAAVPAWSAPAAKVRLRELEHSIGGRIGVAALDTGSGARIAYRADERFPMCSTFKMLLAATILHRVDTDCEKLERRLPIAKADLKPNSPGTEPHVGGDLPISDLCEYAMIYSDNTAANLLLAALGGPEGVTAYARSLGDKVTRLDRYETDLNVVPPGDLRDTTSPSAMLATMRKVLLGQALSPASRDRLTGWMIANRTGDARLRAGVPKTWRVGDKTGTWTPDGGVNDIAILWPPGRAPILVTAYTVGSARPIGERNAAVAEIGRIVAESL